MDYYFIDFENFNGDKLKRFVSHIKYRSELFFFYSDTCSVKDLSFYRSMHDRKIKFIHVESGKKNALDFQLSSYLGYQIRQHGETEKYFIVSNDKGYDCLINFWRERRIKINRLTI